MFDIQLYKNYLTAEFIGNTINYSAKLDSTNLKAWELVSKNAEEGTIVITDNQTSGRGRQTNKWYSTPNKSLTFSIILYPNSVSNQINLYSPIVGLAVTDCLIENNIQAQLKWPNDISINGKKVGGILCESKISEGLIKSLVIGIGLNINNNESDLPHEIRAAATSLIIESGRVYKLEIILASILNNLEHRLNNIENVEKHMSDWENRCGHLNKQISINVGTEKYFGLFKGLTNTGQAIIEIDGKKVTFDSGEVSELGFK